MQRKFQFYFKWPILGLLCLLFGQIACDYTQLGWDLPFRDAQHTSLAPVRGPGDGAAIKWSKMVEKRTYPVPFTVAAHVGHIFITDNEGSILAYDSVNKGSHLWTRPLLNSTLASRGTVDITPVVLSSGPTSRQIAVASCQQYIPHQCVLAVLDEDGNIIWSTETTPQLVETTPLESSSRSKSEKSRKHASEISWTGRIYQVVSVDDGELIIVPLCPKMTSTFQNDCVLMGINSDSGVVEWSQDLPGPVRGDLLVSRGGIVLVPMCDFDVLVKHRECLRIFTSYQAVSGEKLWYRSWNDTLPALENMDHTKIAGTGDSKAHNSGNANGQSYGLQLNSQYTGIVADGTFVTLADDFVGKVWAYGMDMSTGHEQFKILIPVAKTARHFVACAAMPAVGKPRQLFFMTSDVFFSLDSKGAMIWKNENVSNYVRSMIIDTQGAIYVATTQKRSNTKYVSSLDVYDAKGGRFSYSLSVPQCSDTSPVSMPIVPTFTITSQRWVIVLCQSKFYALYSSAVPIWAWVTLAVFFALVFAAIFLLGYLYHRKHNRVFEVLE